MATGSDLVEELVTGWRTLAGWSADGSEHPGYRTWNRLVDELVPLEEKALADPEAVTALQRVAEADEDAFVRAEAQRALDPGVPDDGWARDRWTRHPMVGLADVALRWRPALMLTPAVPPYDDEAVDDSRLLGVRTGPPDAWPRRSDGLPLVLVLDVSLTALAEFGDLGIDDLLGLPFAGRLQVFHDLETWGGDPADGATGAWLVRHVPGAAAPEVGLPDDAGTETRRPAVDVRLRPFTAVAPARPLTPTTADAFERAERRLVDAVRRRADAHGPGTLDRPGPPSDDELDNDPSIGRLPRLLGLPQLPPDDLRDRLHAVRPDVRDWQLLAAFPGVGPFDGLFGDLGHLEVWCPATDLAAGRLDTAWCLIRR